jgi:hypothetical protein
LRTRVYVSGPITSDPGRNTCRAIEVGQELLDAGYAPLVPHLSLMWEAHVGAHANSWDDWLAMDLAWVDVADAVFLIPGHSPGADAEVEAAYKAGIPVYQTLEGLQRDINPERPDPTAVCPEAQLPAAVNKAVARAVVTFAKKNKDYAADNNWRSNFDEIARDEGRTACSVADTMINVKQARLRALRENGRTPTNESTEDTYLDRMVYSILAYALYLDDNGAA